MIIDSFKKALERAQANKTVKKEMPKFDPVITSVSWGPDDEYDYALRSINSLFGHSHMKSVAKKGSAKAMAYIACGCRQGINKYKKDLDEALAWGRKSAELGNMWGQYEYGMALLATGKLADSFHWISESAKQGYRDAFFQLGRMYENGIGTDADLDLAAYWYALALKEGIPDAQKCLDRVGGSVVNQAEYLGKVLNFPVNPSYGPDELLYKSSFWESDHNYSKLAFLLRAAEKGSYEAYEKLAEYFSKSSSKPFGAYDPLFAEDCLREMSALLNQKAKAGDGPSLYELGKRHLQGVTLDSGEVLIEKDPAKARASFEKGADLGDPECLVRFGEIVRDEGDIDRAFKCFDTAAQKGHFVGAYFAAWMWEEGRGTHPDLNRAVEYFEMAAKHQESMYGKMAKQHLQALEQNNVIREA